MASCRAQGLLLIKAGLYDNVIRLLMPLVTTDEQLVAGLDMMQSALAAAATSLPATTVESTTGARTRKEERSVNVRAASTADQ